MSTVVTPRALVVFESMFGNTARVAVAVARGLQLEGVETTLAEVASAAQELDVDLDLLVVGGPTHTFTLSRAGTREDAVRQGAPRERAALGLREWLASVRPGPAHAPGLAAFDTRVAKVRWLPQAAARSAVRAGRKRGLVPVARPIGFLVEGLQGPLVAHELERAVAWGRRLGVECTDRTALVA